MSSPGASADDDDFHPVLPVNTPRGGVTPSLANFLGKTLVKERQFQPAPDGNKPRTVAGS